MAVTYRFYRSVQIGSGTSMHDAFRNKLGDPPYSIKEDAVTGAGFWDLINDARPVRYTLCACESALHTQIATDTEIVALSPELADQQAVQDWLDGAVSGVPQSIRDVIEGDGISLSWAAAQNTKRDAFRYLSKIHVSIQDLKRLKNASALQFFAANLTATVNSLPVQVRNQASSWMQSKGLDTSWITGTTTVRQVLQYVIENINWPVLPFRADMPLEFVAVYTYAFTTTENPVADGTNLTAGMGAWGNMQATGGRGRGSVANQDDAAMLNTSFATIGAAQYAQLVLTTSTGAPGTNGRDTGPTLRHNSTTDGDCYTFDLDDNGPDMAIYRCADTGTLAFTKLGASLSTTDPVAGHTYKMTASGTTLEAFDNGVSIGTRTDSTYSSGQPGFFMNSQTLGIYEIDTYEAGDLVAAGLPTGQEVGVGTGESASQAAMMR